VLFGVKRKPASPSTAVVNRLVAFGKGQDQLELPEIWDRESYIVPGLRVGVNSGGNTSDDFHFTVIRLDARQLDAELDQGLHKASLWPRFEQLMGMRTGVAKRPLRAMTDWHLALALAAGQISGIVQSEGGRRLLIKGRTHKAKDAQVTSETAADGTVSETRVLTDKFITVIRAIDLTPGPDLGKIVTIA